MTSTTAESSAQLRTEIDRLFSWNPPRLILADSGGTKSRATRQPSFYDKHFDDGIVLKRVVRFPSLVQQLAKNVDITLDATSKIIPQSLDRFITANQRQIDEESLNLVIQNEKEVVSFYEKTTARYCARVASTLVLHPTASEWHTLLYWTESVGPSGHAIMDGILRFLPYDAQAQNAQQQAAIAETIESKYLDVFEDIRKSGCPFATWEMKSISAGPSEVMTEVPDLGKFSWTNCDLKVEDCDNIPVHRRARDKVKNVKVGPDALNPPWDLSDRGEETNVTGRVTRSAAWSRQPLASHLSEGGPSTNDKGKKRKLEPEEDEDNDEGEEDNEVYPAQPVLTAQSLVQQAWAQAVRVDGTIIVLHSGNHELVCIRNRATQTLYISNIIEPPECVDPGYGKLHIGIYIAAIQETIDRQLQLKQNPPGDGGSDLIGGDEDQDRNWGSGSGRKDGHRHCRGGRRGGRGGGHTGGRGGSHRGSRRGGHGARKSNRLQGLAGVKGPTDNELVAIEKAIHVVNNRNVVLLYLQYGIYNSPIPASFLRSAPPIMAHTGSPTPPFSPRAIHTYRLEECLTIVLTSEIGQGATGVVHRGTLELDLQSGTTALDVVVKLAFDTGQQDALRNEYEIYRHLQSKGVCQGIATTLGIFNDSEGAACALVMLYAGIPLCEESQGNLSISNRESALSTLNFIHHADILHGDIRHENILIGDSGVTIIDFGYSKQCSNQKAKNKESVLLRNFLGLENKSH